MRPLTRLCLLPALLAVLAFSPALAFGFVYDDAWTIVDNAWLEGQALIATIEPGELIDPTIEPERLLYRLFHEHGVRVFRGTAVEDRCSCSRSRIRGILEGFSAEETSPGSGTIFDVNSTDWAMKFGGGLDYQVHKNVDIRFIQFDWNPIWRGDQDFGPNVGVVNGVMQNNWLIGVGVVLKK